MKTLFVTAITMVFSLWISAWADNYDATIDFSPRLELSLPVSGIIEQVKVKPGQHVKQGEILLTLDDAPFKAELALMQSRVAFHQARLDEARRDLDHQQELYDRTVLSTVELENAQLRVRRVEALLESARANLARVNYAYGQSRLRAPFDALIIAVYVNQGQAINNVIQSNPLVSLVREHSFVASINATAAQIAKLALGKPATVVVADSSYSGRIAAISYEPAQSSKGGSIGGEQRYPVSVEFTSVNTFIPVGSEASVIVD
jgi:RND family efflux transporter MFP subunit